MHTYHRPHIFILIIATISLMIAAACANRGAGPQGGPKDVTPPRLLKCTPTDNSLNVTTKTLELQFDEIVKIESPFEKVIISPPQSTPAQIKALGHKIKVELQDNLIDSTTYTINFTDAIADNNEGNKLDGLSIGFSTGDHIDSLQMCGAVIDAETLNPVVGILLGIHSDTTDTAFTKIPFSRISKTNSKGEFCISNIATGSYRIFALKDMGNNYRFDIPTEQIAFLDSIYTPEAEVHSVFDTIGDYYVDSITQVVDSSQFLIDTIISRHYTTFTPNEIILRSFVEKDFRHYLTRNERKVRNSFSLMFSSPCDSLPELCPLDFPDSCFTYLLQKNATTDTLTYWLTDSAMIATDTLRLQLTYYRINLDTQYTSVDTLTLTYREPKTNANAKKKGPVKPKSLEVKSNASTKYDYFRQLTITLPTPATINDTANFQLELVKDSIFTPIKANIIRADSIGMTFTLDFNFEPATSYHLTLDSAYFINLDSLVSDKIELKITTKSLEEYGKIIFTIKDYRGSEVIQLLDKSDKVVLNIPTTEATTTIEHLTPGTYWARLFFDDNHNGMWDTGSYKDRQQPEEVHYFPYEIELKAFWDVEEDWDINELPLLQQKPAALIKTDKK